ncbi:MAG: methyltransferase domain-containing protein [Sphingorhabdus sp.]
MESVDFGNMRRAMVDSQLRTSGVTAAWVIAAMGGVARENFAPDTLKTTAYMDRALPLGGGRALNPPLATGLMLEAAEVGSDDKVLLIGAGTGYVARLLAERAASVVAVEESADLIAVARGNLAGRKNVKLVEGPLAQGAASSGPYSVIIIDGAVGELPDSIVAQAAEDAIIVTGIIDGAVTRLASGHARGGRVALRPFADSEIAALPGFARTKEFVF